MLHYTNTFASFSVDDLAKAKDFYSNLLGLNVKEDEQGMLNVELHDGQWFLIYPKGEGHTPATFTVMNFLLENIEQTVDELTAKGVKFEQYDTEYIKTNEKGIADFSGRKIAWFTDPAGNILSVIQENVA